MNACQAVRILVPLVFVSLLTACSDAPAWMGSVEMRDGIEVISNPADPLFGETQGLVSELWSVQDPAWVDPSLVHAAGELVLVVDPRANQVHLATSSGETRTSLGRPGGGPGEFLGLRDAFGDGDKLAVIDGGKGSIEFLDFDGNYLSSVHLPGTGWRGFTLRGGVLLVKGEFLNDPGEMTYGDWILVNEDGEPTRFTPVELAPLPEEQGVRCSDIYSWGSGAARLRFTTPQIQQLDHEGVVAREITIDLPIEVVSDVELDSALAALRRNLAGRGLPPEFMQQTVVVSEERWRVKCRFGPLRFDSDGRLAALLEQNPDQFGSGNATLHFLSENGVYLAAVDFPDPWRDFTLDGGVVYALTRETITDLITLRAYLVDLPEAQLANATEALRVARQRAVEG